MHVWVNKNKIKIRPVYNDFRGNVEHIKSFGRSSKIEESLLSNSTFLSNSTDIDNYTIPKGEKLWRKGPNCCLDEDKKSLSNQQTITSLLP